MSKKTAKHSKKSFPTIFFRSVPNELLKKHSHQDFDRQKYIWLWACVGLVMAAVIFFWAATVPGRLKLEGGADATTLLFKENKDKLSTLFEENKKTMRKTP